MSNEHYFSLQHSESIVATMAATIFAAYVQSGKINEANEDEYLKKAANAAVRLASYTDKIVKSDAEWMKQEGGPSHIL